MLSIQIDGINLQFLPPTEAVSGSGGGRPITERTAITGEIIPLRNPLPTSRRLTITAPAGFAISAADAAAIRALGDGPFSVTLSGYDPSGTFSGCVFEQPPRFPPTFDPRFVGYDLTLYIPQGGP